MSLLDKQEVQDICGNTALHARKWSGFICKQASEDITLGLLKKEEEKEECQIGRFFFTSRSAYVKLRYTIGNQVWNTTAVAKLGRSDSFHG